MRQSTEQSDPLFAFFLPLLRVMLTIVATVVGEIGLLQVTYHIPRDAPEAISLVFLAPLVILLAVSTILGIWRRGMPLAAQIVVGLAFFAMPLIALIYELELECDFALGYCS